MRSITPYNLSDELLLVGTTINFSDKSSNHVNLNIILIVSIFFILLFQQQI